MLSVILVSIMAFAITPAFAMGSVNAPTIQNPSAGPGSTFTVDIYSKDIISPLVYTVEFKLKYTTSILTATNIYRNLNRPVMLGKLFYQTIDDSTGIITFSAQYVPLAGTDPIDGFNSTFGQILIIIAFTVDARGVSTLDLYDVTLKDYYGNVIPVNTVDGSFDNRIEGTVSVPHTIDTTIGVGSFFDVFVYVDDVVKMWGYQFVLKFDPNVVQAIDFQRISTPPQGFTQGYPSEIGSDYVSMGASRFFGDSIGFTTTTPMPIARIGFIKMADGVTTLDLQNVVVTNIRAKQLIVDVQDGSFANTLDLAVALDTGFVEKHHVFKSEQSTFGMAAQIKNVGSGVTKAKVTFNVLDASGLPAGSAVAPVVVDIMPGSTIRVDGTLNLAPLPTDALYDVVFTVEYLDANGVYVVGMKGAPGATRTTMIKSFVVEP